MHVRFSMVCGTTVVENHTDSVLGRIADILIHPDTGAIAGFFIRGPGFFAGRYSFLAAADIIAWGTQVHVLDDSRLSDPSDIVRISRLLQDRRHVLYQRVVTKKEGRYIGLCRDIQFDTRQFTIEWLFPRKWLFFWGIPVPASDIVEVTPKAVIIKEQAKTVMEKQKQEAMEVALPDVIPATTFE